jgi:hypothetical protein
MRNLDLIFQDTNGKVLSKHNLIVAESDKLVATISADVPDDRKLVLANMMINFLSDSNKMAFVIPAEVTLSVLKMK